MNDRQVGGLETREAPPCESTEIQNLVRQLAKQAAKMEEPAALCTLEHVPHEVLLDVEMDGMRCLLLRVQSRARRLQDHLSPREQEIARMVAGGYPNKTIAAVLDISIWTVGTYLRRIYAKVGVSTRAAMVARLLDENALTEAPLSCVHTARILR